MAESNPSVSDALHESGAVQLRAAALGRGLSLAEWRNRDSLACYERPNHHTFSLYLSGGQGVTREDGGISGGGPDKLCVLPAGHRSRWRIEGMLQIFHLYVSPEALAFQAAMRFGAAFSGEELMDLTFADDPEAAMIVRGGILPLAWADGADRMALSSACQALLHRLLRHRRPTGTRRLRGGLSPTSRRRVADHIEAHLSDPLTLELLAGEAGLSTFHFAKMFRASFGVAPHRYVVLRRIERAKDHLADGCHGLAGIASACGFSSPSHFNRAFRQATGTTPATWRGLTKSSSPGLDRSPQP